MMVKERDYQAKEKLFHVGTFANQRWYRIYAIKSSRIEMLLSVSKWFGE